MRVTIIFLLTLFSSFSFAQTKYWIFFKDKDLKNYNYTKHLSPKTIENRKRFGLELAQYSDVPITVSYIKSISQFGVELVSKSKWLNGISAELTDQEVLKVRTLPFVKSIEKINTSIRITSTYLDPTPKATALALAQMQSELFLQKGITGKGVDIGVVDAGFHKANDDRFLKHLFTENRIKQQCDFLDPLRTDIIDDNKTEGDYHGRIVLDMLAGYDSGDDVQSGMAPNGNYFLARTEDGAHEYRGEEDKWMEAMEWLDSLGVRLISTSLGYAIKMDEPKDNYEKEDMNGKTTRISKAANIAINEKGIFLVVSAGNEGSNESWTIISSPADVEGALSVGATRDFIWDKIGYSSIGPDFLPYLKPNVSCFSPNGTSFSAPAVAGFVACLMEMDSTLSNRQLKSIMEKSSHLYPYGNNYIGYGIPRASRAIKLLVDSTYKFDNTKEIHVQGDTFKVSDQNRNLKGGVLFHKKNATIVVKQDQLKPLDAQQLDLYLKAQDTGKKMSKRKRKKLIEQRAKLENKQEVITIVRPPNVKRSTLAINGEVLEIFWD
ncbi:MAG TPA: S8 family serine peptidase [Cytophagaceae bacterium]|jgi:hypothetical protein